MATIGGFVSIEGWDVASQSSGTKEGYWLVEPLRRRQALVKKPRVRSNPDFYEGEVVGEYLASAIGHQLGLRVAEVQITQYDGLFCPLIWNFCNKDWVLKEGVDLTNTRGGGKYALSLPEIEEALSHTELPAAHIKQYLTDLVCFDILIGNTDRHQQNWGILESSQSQLTAPFYDQGGAFGSSQHPERLKEILTDDGRMSVFDNRFRYEIRLSRGVPKPHLTELLEHLNSHFESNFQKFKERLDGFQVEDLDFSVIPLVNALQRRAEFARELVSRRRKLILEWNAG